MSFLSVATLTPRLFYVKFQTAIQTLDGPSKGKRMIYFQTFTDKTNPNTSSYTFNDEDNIKYSKSMKACFPDSNITGFELNKEYTGEFDVPKDIWVIVKFEKKPNDVVISCEDIKEDIIIKDAEFDFPQPMEPLDERLIL